MDRGDAMAAPLLGEEAHHEDGVPHDHLAQAGSQPHQVSWLSEQLRGAGGAGGEGGILAESPGQRMLGAAATLPSGYHQPKLSTRMLARHHSMANTRAR